MEFIPHLFQKPASLPVLLLMALLLAACSRSSAPQVVEKQVTVPVTVLVSQPLPATATHAGPPAYVSHINAPPGTLVYPLPAAPLSLDPQEASDESSVLVAHQLYAGLFEMRGDGELVPAAATGYRVSADTQVYTVTLREGMRWSDGEPVTAQHFVDGVCRSLDPATGSDRASFLVDAAHLAGAAAYASGARADCAQVGFRAVDSATLRIELSEPSSSLPQLLTDRAFFPSRTAAERPLPLDQASGSSTTNGPFLLEQWTPERIVLRKNPEHWNAGTVTIERIDFRVVPDPASQLALYEQGELHVAGFPPEAAGRFLNEPALAQELRVLDRPGTSFLALNTRLSPTSDANVRRAIASAIDRTRLIQEALGQPWHRPAWGLIPPGLPGHSPEAADPYDPALVQGLLAAAGYGPDVPPPVIELWTNNDGSNLPLMQAVATMLEEAGMATRLVSSNWDLYLAALNACVPAGAETGAAEACGFNLYRMGWVMEYADPANILDQVFRPGASLQYTGWQSDEYENLLAQARQEPDPARRAHLYRAAEQILIDQEVVVVPLLHYDRRMLVKDGVTFDYPPFGPPNLHAWRLP